MSDNGGAHGLNENHQRRLRITFQYIDKLLSEARHNYVVTVCSEADAQGCPIFPGIATRLHWSFDDPSRFEGTTSSKLEQTRRVRDAIKTKIEQWCETTCLRDVSEAKSL